jgi:hypothetical protein
LDAGQQSKSTLLNLNVVVQQQRVIDRPFPNGSARIFWGVFYPPSRNFVVHTSFGWRKTLYDFCTPAEALIS